MFTTKQLELLCGIVLQITAPHTTKEAVASANFCAFDLRIASLIRIVLKLVEIIKRHYMNLMLLFLLKSCGCMTVSFNNCIMSYDFIVYALSGMA